MTTDEHDKALLHEFTHFLDTESYQGRTHAGWSDTVDAFLAARQPPGEPVASRSCGCGREASVGRSWCGICGVDPHTED